MTEKKTNTEKPKKKTSKAPGTNPSAPVASPPISNSSPPTPNTDLAAPNSSPPASNTSPPAPAGQKAGFYSGSLPEAEAAEFEEAARREGLDDEITLMRIKIREILAKDPDNIELFMRATNTLARLVKIRHSTAKKQDKNLGEAIKNIITEIGVPLGVVALNKKL